MPTVSVIIPAYNAARTILRCVNSVLEQSFKDVECIVIDDGSSDNTAEILGGIGDERLRYIYKENGGVSSSRNRGLDEAKGEYIILNSPKRQILRHLAMAVLSYLCNII